MRKPEFTLEIEAYNIPWDFKIQTDPLILTRKLHLVIINYKKQENLPYSRFCRPSEPIKEKQRKWRRR